MLIAMNSTVTLVAAILSGIAMGVGGCIVVHVVRPRVRGRSAAAATAAATADRLAHLESLLDVSFQGEGSDAQEDPDNSVTGEADEVSDGTISEAGDGGEPEPVGEPHREMFGDQRQTGTSTGPGS